MSKRTRTSSDAGPAPPSLRGVVADAHAANAAADTALTMSRQLTVAKNAAEDAIARMNASNAVMMDLYQQIKSAPDAAAHVDLRKRLDEAVIETKRLTHEAAVCQRDFDALYVATGEALAVSARALGLPDPRVPADAHAHAHMCD